MNFWLFGCFGFQECTTFALIGWWFQTFLMVYSYLFHAMELISILFGSDVFLHHTCRLEVVVFLLGRHLSTSRDGHQSRGIAVVIGKSEESTGALKNVHRTKTLGMSIGFNRCIATPKKMSKSVSKQFTPYFIIFPGSPLFF